MLIISDHLTNDAEAFAPLESPLFPMKLFKIRNYTVSVVVGCVGQMAFYALNVLWPQHISRLYTQDNLTIGWMSVSVLEEFCKSGRG